MYLILISIGRVPAESATPELSQPDTEPRNHVICIDGTWNHPEVPTNVRKFFDYVDVDADGKQQIAKYYSGVGARENKGVALRVLKKNYSGLLFGGATGYGSEAILRQAYFDFVQEYRRGNRSPAGQYDFEHARSAGVGGNPASKIVHRERRGSRPRYKGAASIWCS